jgi:hypothetical protein
VAVPTYSRASSNQKVKIGAYFLSQEACQQIEGMYSSSLSASSSSSAAVSQTALAVISSSSTTHFVPSTTTGETISLSITESSYASASSVPMFSTSGHSSSVSFQASSMFLSNAGSDEFKEEYVKKTEDNASSRVSVLTPSRAKGNKPKLRNK